MISKLFCLLVLLSLQMQGREASIVRVVETIPEITVTFGEEGLLKCAYERKAFAVFWRFVSDDSSYGDLLVALDQYFMIGARSGPGYDEGRFNITNDYSLIINDVSVEDEGRYICEVSDFETGRVFRNYTNVTVIVQAARPLVRIHQCGSNSPVSVNVTGDPKASCMIQITPNQPHAQLDCFVEGAKPQVDMFWVNNNKPLDLLNGTSFITQGKREGTVDQKLTVIVKVSEFQFVQEYFTCIAEGQAVGGMASVTVRVNKVTPDGVSLGISASVGLVVFVVLFLVTIISVLLWKKYKRLQSRKDGDFPMDYESIALIPDKRQSLLDKRKKIKDFSPNTSKTMNDDTNHINLGVFGIGKAGKSSLINSLIFSLTGQYPGEADNEATTHSERDITGQKEEIKLTDHIHLLNFKGMVKCDPAKRKEILSQIKGQPIQNTPNVPVHCAIFICDYKNRKGLYEKFMKLLSNDVCSYFGRGIMLGILNKGDLDDGDDKIKAEMADTIGIPENHVWIFKNYTLESHEENVERSIELLDFILHCLTVVKGNQQFRATQKETQQFQGIQKENQHNPNIQKEKEQIRKVQKENKEISNIKIDW